jgi:hypothetical protein
LAKSRERENPDGYCKRDVHDIEKYFWYWRATIMRLLTLVSWCPEKIAAIEHNVDIIGLSGLITHRWTKWFIWPKN